MTEATIDIVERLREQILTNEDIEGGWENSLISQLDAAVDGLERALVEIEDERAKQANNALNAATRQLGAFLNSFDARRNDRDPVDDGRAFSIRTGAEGAIENAAKAKDADI